MQTNNPINSVTDKENKEVDTDINTSVEMNESIDNVEKNTSTELVKKLTASFDKVRRDLAQIRGYVDHWKTQFDVAKREHAVLLKSDNILNK